MRTRNRGRPPHERTCEQCGGLFDQDKSTSKKRFCPTCKEVRDRDSDKRAQQRRTAKARVAAARQRRLPDWHGDWDDIGETP